MRLYAARFSVSLRVFDPHTVRLCLSHKVCGVGEKVGETYLDLLENSLFSVSEVSEMRTLER